MSYELKDKNSAGSQWVRLDGENSPQKGLLPGGGSGLVTVIRGVPNGTAGAIATGARLSATGSAATAVGTAGAGAAAGSAAGVVAAGLAGGIGTFGAATGGVAALAAHSQTIGNFRAVNQPDRHVAYTGGGLGNDTRTLADYKRITGSKVISLAEQRMAETKENSSGNYLRQTLSRPVKTDEEKKRRKSGVCRCPGQIDKGNNRCGGRAAWWKPAGETPNCSGVPSATGNKKFGKAMLAALGENKASAYKVPL